MPSSWKRHQPCQKNTGNPCFYPPVSRSFLSHFRSRFLEVCLVYTYTSIFFWTKSPKIGFGSSPPSNSSQADYMALSRVVFSIRWSPYFALPIGDTKSSDSHIWLHKITRSMASPWKLWPRDIRKSWVSPRLGCELRGPKKREEIPTYTVHVYIYI